MKKRGVFAEKSNWNILKLLKIRASEYGNKEFVRFDSGNALSFKSLDELSDKMAYKLLNIGLKEDENVFCLLKNSPEFLIALFAVMKTGAVFVPINTELRGQFLEHQYLNCEPKIAPTFITAKRDIRNSDPFFNKQKTFSSSLSPISNNL